MLYRAVVQVLLLFGVDSWVLSAAISRKLEGVHVGFLIQVTGQTAKRQRYGTCRSVVAASVLKGEVTQALRTYIEKRQEKVAEWVVLSPILEVCNRETVYE